MLLKKGITIKALCIGLVLSLAFNQAAFGAQVPPPQEFQPLPAEFASKGFLRELTPFAAISDFYLPQEKPFSLIDDLLTDPESPLVIYLQDAHGNLSAQKNIAEIIRLFSRQADLKEPWIALEGTEVGEIDHGVLSAFPDRQIRSRIAEYFMRRGEMDGADYFTARYNPKARHFGIDAEELTQKHRESYREFLLQRAGAESALARLSKASEILKNKIYSGDLVKLDRLVKHYEADRNYIHRYIPALLELAGRHQIALEKYPGLLQLIGLKRGRRSQEERAVAQLNGTALLSELERMEDELWGKLLFYREARDARAIDKAAQFYRRLCDFSLLPRDYASYLENREAYDLDSLKGKYDRYTFVLKPEELRPNDRDIGILKKAAAPAFLFYHTAHERNRPLTENLLALLKKNPDRKLFLISGGFHEEQIVSRLKEERIPFVIVAPRISGEEGTENYWRLLGGDSSPSDLQSVLASHYKLPKRYSDPPFQQEVALLLAAASGVNRPLLDEYAGRLGEVRASSLLGTWRRNLTPYGQGWVGYDADPAVQGPELVLYVGEGGKETIKLHSDSPVDLAGFEMKDHTLLEDGWSVAVFGRREVRSTQKTVLTPKQLLEIEGDPREKLDQWIGRISDQLAQTAQRANQGAVLNAQNLKTLIARGFKQTGDPEEVIVSKILGAFKKKETLTVVFSESLENPVEWSEQRELRFDLKTLRVFNKLNYGFADLFVALAVRNYFIGYLIYREDKDPVEKKHERNRKLAEVVLKGLEAKARQSFIQNLAEIVRRYEQTGQPPSYLKELSKGLVVGESDLASRLGKDLAPGEGLIDPRRLPFGMHLGPKNPDYPSGKYVVEKRIGGGGMGSVYRARDRWLDINVAIKTFNQDEVDANEQDRKEAAIRRSREISALAELHGSPGIVRVTDYYNIDKKTGVIKDPNEIAFFVMEEVQGEPLDKILEREERLAPKRAIAIVKLIARALQSMHRKGFIHRDIKPANMILDETRVTLIDLGLVTRVGEAAEFATDKTGHGVGTPAYMAPETWLQLSAYPTVDLYAVGAILYQMITGQVPNDSDPDRDDKKKDKKKEQTMREVMERTIRGDYHDPNDFDGVQIDDGLRQILWGLLAQPVEELKEGEAQQFFSMIYSFSGVKLRDSAGRIVLAPGAPQGKREETVRNIKTGRVKLLTRYTTDELIRDLEAWPEKRSGKEGSLRKSPASVRPVRPSDPTIALRRPRQTKSSTAYILAGLFSFVSVAILLFFILRPKPSDQPNPPSVSNQSRNQVTKVTPPEPTKEPVKIIPTPPANPDKVAISEGSMEFDGIDDTVIINHDPSLSASDGNVTVAFQIYILPRAGYEEYQAVLAKRDFATARSEYVFGFRLSPTGRASLGWGFTKDGGRTAESHNFGFSSGLETGKWIFVTATKERKGNDTVSKIYIDRVLIDEVIHRNSAIVPNRGNITVGAYILGKNGEIGSPGHFRLRDLSIFTKALSQEQVKELNRNLSSVQSYLSGHWELNKIVDGKITDLSGKGNHAVTRGGPQVVNSSPIRKRSELRKAGETELNPALLGDNNALLVFPFDKELVETYTQNHIPISRTRVIFVARPGELEKARSAFGHLEKIYGFRILEANTDVGELKPESLELNNILQRARAAFGTTQLGIPVIFLKDSSLRFETREGKGTALTQEFLQKTRAFRLRYDPARFIRDASYQEAHLLAGSALSQGISGWFNGPVVSFRGSDLAFTDSFLDSIIQNLESITASLRSA